MDERQEWNEELEQEPEHYVPRPKWQIVAARVMLVILLIGIAGWYYWIANSGSV